MQHSFPASPGARAACPACFPVSPDARACFNDVVGTPLLFLPQQIANDLGQRVPGAARPVS
jgi:hypothetical protein